MIEWDNMLTGKVEVPGQNWAEVKRLDCGNWVHGDEVKDHQLIMQRVIE